MYIPNKYNYTALKKENIDGSRKYVTPDGRHLPSVTTILEATKPEEAKRALANWKKSIGIEKANEIVKESSGRGTRLHKWLENYVKNGIIGEPGSNPYSKQSHTMAKTIIEQGLKNCNEFWGTEVSLYFPEIYAGTTDLVGMHAGDEAILDFKQTNKPKKREWIEDYFLQLAAYANAHNELFGTKIRKGVILMCSKDNEYQEFVVEGNEFDIYSNLWFHRLELYYKQFL